MKFYVYAHYAIGEDVPFYIGKGSGKRAWSKDGRSFWWWNIVKKYGLEVRILLETDIESIAFEKEKQLITEYGRRDLNTGTLVNLTDGGEGASGLVYTDDIKKSIHNDKWKVGVLIGANKRKNDPIWRENKIKSCKELSLNKKWRDTVSEKNKKMSKDANWITKQKEGINNFYNNPDKLRKYREAVTKKRSRYFGKVQSPDGTIYDVYNVVSFCKEHDLVVVSFRRIKNIDGRSYKGWKYLK